MVEEETKKTPEEFDGKKFGGKVLLGGIFGIALTKITRYAINKWRQGKGLPPIEEQEGIPVPVVESTAIVISGVNYKAGWSPWVLGLATGKIASDCYPLVKDMVVTDGDKKPSLDEGTPPGNWDIKAIEIKPGKFMFNNKEFQLNQLEKILGAIVTKDSMNRKINKIVPAGYRHPLVIWYGRQALLEANVRGDDFIGTCNAVTSWIRKHVPYSFDPQSANDDEDFFFHPARVLETYDKNTGRTIPIDCDCQALLAASMLMSLGYKPVFILFAQKSPNFYNHIICAAIAPTKFKGKIATYPFYPCEGTMTNVPIDYMPKYLSRAILRIGLL